MFSGISIWQLIIILAIVVLLFGTKKLRNMGGDLGGAVKGFKNAMKDGEEEQDDEEASPSHPLSLSLPLSSLSPRRSASRRFVSFFFQPLFTHNIII